MAEAAGAVGVILFNEGDTSGRMTALFRSGPTDLGIPAVLSSFAVGKELYEEANPTARLKTSGVNVPRFFPQVIAETPTGDPNHVVLAGAHLDSVMSGPGINDDGSGSAWQLELGEQIAKLGTKPRHKIRLMWFGGEEDGLVGSLYYSANLPQAEIDKIDVMIDTDMIASPNYVRSAGSNGVSVPTSSGPGRGSRRDGVHALVSVVKKDVRGALARGVAPGRKLGLACRGVPRQRRGSARVRHHPSATALVREDVQFGGVLRYRDRGVWRHGPSRPCPRRARYVQAVRRSPRAGGPDVRCREPSADISTSTTRVDECSRPPNVRAPSPASPSPPAPARRNRSAAEREIARDEWPARRSKPEASCSRTGFFSRHLRRRAPEGWERHRGNRVGAPGEGQLDGLPAPPLDGYDLTARCTVQARGHAVIVVAEGAGQEHPAQEPNTSDASGTYGCTTSSAC